MKVPGLENAHLTYCLNVHPGATLAEAEAAIFEKAPRVFSLLAERVGARGPFGLGAWFSAQAASELVEGDRLENLADRLADHGLYIFTLNGFPYGRFHGARVKEKVYRPDWADPARRDYTIRLADILARLLPEGVEGTISTLPVTFRPWADEPRLAASVRHLAEVAAHLAELERASGRTIALALEPEPGCFLERTDDVLDFFARRLLAEGAGDVSEATLRHHIGVCLDTVHTAVMFEDAAGALARLAESGTLVLKVQLGGALEVRVGEAGPPAALRDFADAVYLHQVTVRGPDGEQAYLDLPEALGEAPRGTWRVHFHVPLGWEGSGAVGGTGGGVDGNFIAAALRSGVRHFELEIYTLDVFPGRSESAEDILAADLARLWRLFESRPGAGAT